MKKDEQKQHLIDMMKSDEELGLYDESREIKVEDIFNDEKRENIKKFIDEIKNPSEPNQALKDAAERLKGLSLVNPAHLQMTSNGHGEFPDGYKLTEKGIQYIIEQLNKEEQKEKENDWEEILFDFIDFYPCILPHELFEWLEENYEIPKKKDGKD